MGKLELFLHKDSELPMLINCALIHYQFETIHPFLDGNGRIGRLLTTLQLVDYKILSKPTLYFSDFLSKHRGEYFDALTLVRTSGDIEQWLRFFLNGVLQTANKGKRTFEDIIKLRHEYEGKIIIMGRRAKLGQQLLGHLFSNPVININQAAEALKVTYNTGNSLIGQFVKAQILREITGYSRNQIFLLSEYVDLFKK